MDGTTAGILADLPQFERVKCVLAVVSGVSEYQYLIQSPEFCTFLYSINHSARNQQGEDAFHVQLIQKLWYCVDKYPGLFFSEPTVSHHVGTECSHFISICFALRSTRNPDSDSDGSASDVSTSNMELLIENRFNDIEIPRNIIDFGRYFITGSIVGG